MNSKTDFIKEQFQSVKGSILTFLFFVGFTIIVAVDVIHSLVRENEVLKENINSPRVTIIKIQGRKEDVFEENE